jgi:REP element-mobilizing transposase RayT
MTIARSQIVDVQTTRYYHCISKVVRGAFLMGDGYEHRKVWVEKRLELLANNYAVSVAGFAIMDNHLHVLVYSDNYFSRTCCQNRLVRAGPLDLLVDHESIPRVTLRFIA